MYWATSRDLSLSLLCTPKRAPEQVSFPGKKAAESVFSDIFWRSNGGGDALAILWVALKYQNCPCGQLGQQALYGHEEKEDSVCFK